MRVRSIRAVATWACVLALAGAGLFVAVKRLTAPPADTPSDPVTPADRAMPADTPEAVRIMAAMRQAPTAGEPPEIHRAVRDGQFERLHSMDPLPAGLAGFFVETYRDESRDEAVRDYALQHMAPLYERLLGSAEAAADRATLRDELWAAADSGTGTFAGTALLALVHLEGMTPEIDGARLRTCAARLAAEGDTPSRIAALTLCTRLAVTGGLSGAREAAKDPLSIPLRLAGIAALGRMGEPRDVTVLEAIASEEESPIIRAAVQKALSQRGTNSEPRGGT